MSDQTRKPRPRQDDAESEAATTTTPEANVQEVEDLLDEIDEVLEDNAEEFVRSYVQKGGE